MFSRLAPKVLASVMHDVFYSTKDTVISRAESMWHPTSRLPGAHYCRLNRVHCQMGCQCYGHHRFASRLARLLARLLRGLTLGRRKPYITFLSVPIFAKWHVFELATAKSLIAFRASLSKKIRCKVRIPLKIRRPSRADTIDINTHQPEPVYVVQW